MPLSKPTLKEEATAVAIVILVVVGCMTAYPYLRPGTWPGLPAPAAITVVKSVSFDGGAGGDDWAVGLAYDNSSHVLFVAGCITVAGHGKDIFVAKYDESLNQIKNTTFRGSADADDVGYVITIGDLGMLYVVGYVNETGQGDDIWIAKYNYDLVLQKYVTVNGKANETDDGYGIIYSGGYLYVAGTITDAVQGYNIFVAKFDTDLRQITNVTIDGPASMTDKARFFAFGPDGTLYVSGSMSQPGSKYDIWLARFTTDLVLLNQTVIAGPLAAGEDKGYGIAFDSLGNLFAVGTMTESSQGLNLWLAKFDSQLRLLYNVTIDGPAHGEDTAYSIIMLSDDVLFVTGVYTETSGGTNAYFAEYASDLHLITYLTVDGSAHGYDGAFGPIRGPVGFFYTSGFLTETSEGQNAWLAMVLALPIG